jgi:hypothetical protein
VQLTIDHAGPKKHQHIHFPVAVISVSDRLDYLARVQIPNATHTTLTIKVTNLG